MTCLLNTYGYISNIKNIITFLNEKQEGSVTASLSIEPIENAKSQMEDWNWQEKEELVTKSLQIEKENWFEKFFVRFSPYGNLIVIANDRNIVICSGKYGSNDEMKFNITSRIELTDTENETITAIALIPIASNKVSAEGQPDLTVIMVGLSTGNLKMYTENGTLLITQMFHDTYVMRIKCRSYQPAKYIGWIAQPEEVEILHEGNVLVCLDAFNLINYLRTVRRYNISGNHETPEHISSINLDYKKWKLNNQDTLNDFVSAGLTSENRFDQLFSASMVGGPFERFESIPPISNRFITTGSGPFLSYYNAIEGLSSPGFSEVKAAAGKVTSALLSAAKGWMGFGKSQPQPNVKVKPKIEPPTSLPSRFGLRDSRRTGENIIVAPGNNLAATTDSFGRILLFDVLKGIVIRIFKGYRDAQIGWMSVNDDTSNDTKRYALYLVIYAPRRGLLEVWGCQQGIRVCAFNVGKNAKLIYPGYYMLTLNGSLYTDQMEITKKHQCFIVTTDGVIKTLTIPFHLILSDKSNQTVRDTILLKKLKAILREETQETETLWNELNVIIKDFKTASIKQQALERLISKDYLSTEKLFQIMLEQLKQVEKQGENQSQDSHKLGQFCRYNSRLIHSYMSIKESQKKCSIQTDAKEQDEKISDLCSLTLIDETDLRNYFEIKKFQSERLPNEKKVKFSDQAAEESKFTLPKYIACFEFVSTVHSDSQQKDFSKKRYLELNKNLTSKEKEHLGSFLFETFLKSSEFNNELLNEFLTWVPLKKIQLLDLLVHGWLSQSFDDIGNLYKLMFVLSGYENLSSTTENDPSLSNESKLLDTCDFNLDDERDELDFEDDFVSEYLNEFKTICENSTALTNSLLIVWLFRSILIQSQIETSQLNSLNILSDRLFCLIKLFNLCLIGKNLNLGESFEKSSFVLKKILKKSKGFLSEFLAKNIVLNEYPPKLLTIIDTDFIEEDEKDETKQIETVLLKDEIYNEFYNLLQEARKYLPKSLESDSLLASSAWEAMILFNKNFEAKIEYLELSLKYCAEIGNAIIKQGILSMIWHYNLSKRLQLLTDLIEKVGKTPKDRQLRKEAGLSEDNLIKFIECIMAALELIMEANCSINEVPIFNYDQFWNESNELNENVPIPTNMYLNLSSNRNESKSTELTSSNHKQLVELAAEQKHVNYHLCSFHCQLVKILYLVVKYNIKPVKPYSFFDTKGKHTLFSELHTHPLISNDVDIKIMNARKYFLIRAMNSIMENVENPANIKSKLTKDINDIIETVFTLSKEMGVDLEYIKRNYCCVLYALDYHSEAERILHTIKERELMASQLLVVVGHKVNEIISSHFDANMHAILSTNLASWLKSLGPPEYKIFTIKSKSSLLDLMGSVLSSMPETFSEHKLAAELYEFIDESNILE